MSGGLRGEGRWTTGEAGLPCSVMGAQRTPGPHVPWVLHWSAGGPVPSLGSGRHGSSSSRLRGCQPSTASKGPSLHPLWFSGEVAVVVKSVTAPHIHLDSPLRPPSLSQCFLTVSLQAHLRSASPCAAVWDWNPGLCSGLPAPPLRAVRTLHSPPHTPRHALEALPGRPWLDQAPGGKGAPC